MQSGIAMVLGMLLCAAACSVEGGQDAIAAQPPQPLRACGKGELMGHVPDGQEIAGHRQFQLPVIVRPFGSKREDWAMELQLRVDVEGRPECFEVSDTFGRQEPLDAERRAVLAKIGSWRYAPFVVDGKPAVAVVEEVVREQELPERHLPLPEVPLEQVHVRLERTGCYGTCPSYAVDLHGDGRAVYVGGRFVDVEGRHEYRVPVERVESLVRSLREKNLWSLRESYVAGITDNPTYRLTIDMGGERHTIEDYVGGMVGMPMDVEAFEREVDRAAESDAWINLGMAAVDRLAAEGFRFDSQDGQALLARAISNADAHDEDAIMRLIESGALASATAKVPGRFGGEGRSLLEEALDKRRQRVVERLIGAGALHVHGRVDQQKLDAAFQAAIAAGTLQGVETIWNAGGSLHPSLTYDDRSGDDESKRQRSSVILLLEHQYRQDAWEGQAIAEWLVAKGCDLKARAVNGDTLLHKAASAGDAGFVRYLLDKGMSPLLPGEYGLQPLGGASDEEVALLLLQAGADPSKLDGNGFRFRRYVEENHWGRVSGWLDAHGFPKDKTNE